MTGGREDWFPTSVWGFDHPDPGPLNADLLRRITAEHDLHRRNGFEPLGQFLVAGVAEAVAFQKWDLKQIAPLIATCWANVNGKGASNVVHTHPLCFLSGVNYVQANPGSRPRR